MLGTGLRGEVPVRLRTGATECAAIHPLGVLLHQRSDRLVTPTQSYFTTLDQRRTPGSLRDCGLRCSKTSPALRRRQPFAGRKPRKTTDWRQVCRLPPLDAPPHKRSDRSIASTQNYFTTLDQRRALRSLRDCGFRSAALLLNVTDSRAPTTAAMTKLSCIDVLVVRQLQHSATSQRWISAALRARSRTVVFAD
jgi:hypothetical protein